MKQPTTKTGHMTRTRPNVCRGQNRQGLPCTAFANRSGFCPQHAKQKGAR